ncbi:uncharacterized protein LOC132754090 [Ruditapes philippinarum]|uniref:uncharacterized protein LOC132754090 n=1 Tax=Ruditapes philippinarum TaxID=129788 RepID=UPI00295B984B|nr:uncharacterized protein LOC132754090 [Ruditapes philippinarum]
MRELCGDNAYSTVYMKKRVIEHFGGRVTVTEFNGKHNVITFKSNADAILHAFYRRNGTNDSESEKRMIIKTAAKLIFNDIKSDKYQKEIYPSSSEVMSSDFNMKFLPNSLQLLLIELVSSKKSEKKICSIGQAIIQAAIPKGVIAPLQIGLGVQLHHQFGSKFLIETLHTLGFCSSYHEVQKFETSAASVYGTTIQKSSDQFMQFVADNVDHNTGTLDGFNTFHGMGIIAAVTPVIENKRAIPRVTTTNEDLIAVGKINIHQYKQTLNTMELLKFKKLVDVYDTYQPPKGLDFLIQLARPLRLQSPGWSGIMQMVQSGNHPGKSSVIFMPMIDISPGDMSCIYSTLKFVALQCRSHSTTQVITFDQPLYWKALNIIMNESEESEIKNVVVRLGGFHTEMSFLGSIGRLMENSGLAEILGTIYAANTVGHMLTGKAVSRAVRGHFLVHDVLYTLLIEKAFPQLQQDNSDDNNNNEPIDEFIPNANSVDVDTVRELFEKVLSKELLPDEVNENHLIKTCTLNSKMQRRRIKIAELHNFGCNI